jgi:hypothetical protein
MDCSLVFESRAGADHVGFVLNETLPRLEFATTAAGNLHPDISNAGAGNIRQYLADRGGILYGRHVGGRHVA